MGFYDNWNFDGLKLFSRLKRRSSIAKPCREFLSVVNQLKTSSTSSRNITVAEVGVGYGATALPVLKMLDEGDTYYGFDFEERMQDFMSDLQEKDFGIKCRVVPMGNSHYTGDSYNWNLSKLILDMRDQNEPGLFDAVYLDGAHTFLYTGLGICLLKELLKDDGILILDDVRWTVAHSQKRKEIALKDGMPIDQAEDMQVLRAQKIFLDNDPNFEKISLPDASRGIFRKRPR